MNRVCDWRVVVFLVGCLCFAGCGPKEPPTVPVSGKVLLGGQPLTTGSVTFFPETAGIRQPVGSIGADGSYTVATGEKAGAPVGKYKVVVQSTAPSKPDDPYSLPKSVIAEKYAKSDTTDLVVEVTNSPSPDAYDLKLSK